MVSTPLSVCLFVVRPHSVGLYISQAAVHARCLWRQRLCSATLTLTACTQWFASTGARPAPPFVSTPTMPTNISSHRRQRDIGKPFHLKHCRQIRVLSTSPTQDCTMLVSVTMGCSSCSTTWIEGRACRRKSVGA